MLIGRALKRKRSTLRHSVLLVGKAVPDPAFQIPRPKAASSMNSDLRV